MIPYEIVFAGSLVITTPHSRFASRRVRGEGCDYEMRANWLTLAKMSWTRCTCGNRWSAPMHKLPCTSAVQNKIWKRPKPSAINDMELPTERTIVAYINSHAEPRERRTGGHVIVPWMSLSRVDVPPSGSATQPVVFHVAYTPLRVASTSIPFFRALGNAGSGYGNGMTNDSLPQSAHTSTTFYWLITVTLGISAVIPTKRLRKKKWLHFSH